MEKFKAWKETEPVRLYIYSILVPALALLVAKGVITSEDALYYGAIGAAALGVVPAVEKVRSVVDSPSTSQAKQEALEAEHEMNLEYEYEGAHRA